MRDFRNILLLTAMAASAWILPGCKDGQEPTPVDNGPIKQAQFAITTDFPIVLPVQFNNKDYRFIFDTGCSITTFNDKHKDLLGDFTKTLNGTGSHWQATQIDVYEIPEGADFKLGDINIVGQVGTMDYKTLGAWLEEYDGLLGNDVLGKFIIQLDFTNNQLLLLKPGTDPTPEWGHPFDVQIEGGTPHLHVQLTENVSESFMIDTAANNVYLTQDKFEQLLRELDPDRKYTKRTITPKTRRFAAVVLKDFHLGPCTYDRIRITEYPRSFLGLGFLRRHSLVTIDLPRKKLYLRLRSEKTLSEPAPTP